MLINTEKLIQNIEDKPRFVIVNLSDQDIEVQAEDCKQMQGDNIGYFGQIYAKADPQQQKQYKSNNYNFIVLKPFLKYYMLTSQIYTKQNILISILNNNNVNSMVIIFYIKNIPFSMYKDTTNGKLLDILLNKVVNSLPYLYNNLIEILYLVQQIFYNCPQRYRDVYEKIWYFTNKFLQGRIKFIKDKNMKHKYTYKQTEKDNIQQKNENSQFLNIQKLLGKYPLYMFCCIKNNKTNTKIFKILSKYIFKNRKQFIKIAQRQRLKYLSQCIQTFIQLQHQQINNRKKIKIDNNDLRQKLQLKIIPKIQSSHSLKQYFKNNHIQYQYCIEINGVIVPYYVSQKNMIIIVANKYSLQNNLKYNQVELDNEQLYIVQKQMQNEIKKDLTWNKLDNLQKQNTCDKFNGHLKFQFEMFIKLFPNKKIRIWDDFEGKFILQ